jgi:methyl-accepting chemotaxis protein
MRATTQIRSGVAALLVIQLVTTFSAIVLLGRVAPRIDLVFEREVTALDELEQLSLALYRGDRATYEAVYAEIGAHVEEPAGKPPLERIAALSGPALSGDGPALRAATEQIDLMRAINRSRIETASDDALQLGNTGAWAMVLLGLMSFATSVVVVRRADRKIVAPLREVVAVVEAAVGGDRMRRCCGVHGSAEFMTLAGGLNQLLDHRLHYSAADDVAEVEHNRAAVRTLIEALPSPAVLLANDGAILATNQQAEALLLGEDGESWRLGLAQADERVVAQSVDLTGGHGRLVLLHSGEGTEEATAD